MTNKPVWLLDVDGVINACGLGHVAPRNSFDINSWRLVDGIAMGQTWPIRYSTLMIDRINELSELAEVRWHTTWQHDAPGLGELLGLNKFEVAWDYEAFRAKNGTQKMWTWLPNDDISNYRWWKMYHAVDVINLEKRPLIWTDDDLDNAETALFKREILVDDAKYHLVRPKTDTGLTLKDLDSIASFISQNEGS